MPMTTHNTYSCYTCGKSEESINIGLPPLWFFFGREGWGNEFMCSVGCAVAALVRWEVDFKVTGGPVHAPPAEPQPVGAQPCAGCGPSSGTALAGERREVEAAES